MHKNRISVGCSTGYEQPMEISGGFKRATSGDHQNTKLFASKGYEWHIFITIKVTYLLEFSRGQQEVIHTKEMLKEWWEIKC